MRPVYKPAPQALPPPVKDEWSPAARVGAALVDTIGDYCSFCEMPVREGVLLQSKRSGEPQKTPRLGDWSDLLLACSYCSAVRAGASPVTPDGYLWPDVDATFTLTPTSAFVYQLTRVNVVYEPPAGSAATTAAEVVLVKANASGANPTKAQATIDLYKLNTPYYDAKSNTLTVPTDAESYDARLDLRTFAWKRALETIRLLNEGAALGRDFLPALYAQVVAAAQTGGFWSVWMTTYWAQFPDPKVIEPLFVLTRTRNGYVIGGYQGLPKKGSEPRAAGLPGRPQPPPPGGPWTIFTGTAIDRLAYPTP